MFHVPQLISDLALILGVAAIVTLVFKRLKQPVVLGYLVAGLLVGPHSQILPTVNEITSINVWAELGVIFLLFSLGLEFSFKKLIKVGPSASFTALVEVIAMLGIGFLSGRLLGWSTMDSLFLGGLLSISSTTIILRTFDELGLKGRGFVGLVFGVLVVEDIVAVLMLVLLSTLAVSQQFEGGALVRESLKLTFFMVLWFISGIFLLPSLFSKARKFLSDETLLILAVALCFGMVMFSTQVGFSPALGAFVMGSLLAETREAERIEHLISSVKNLFAAIFFVSVGMLMNPAYLREYWVEILLLSGITVVGKVLSSFLGALFSGQSLRHSVQTSLSLGQIGEFSFVIAALGTSLKVTSDFLYPVAVGVSVISTLLTPYLIRSSDPIVGFIERKLSPEFRSRLDRYNVFSQQASQNKLWKQIFIARLSRVAVNFVIVLAIFLFGRKVLGALVLNWPLLSVVQGQSMVSAIVLLLSAPFLWAIAFGGSSAASLKELVKESKELGPLIFFEIFRILLSLFLFVFYISRFFLPGLSFGLVTATVVIVALVLSWRGLAGIYRSFENRFFSNWQDKENFQKSGLVPHSLPALAPWDAHISFFEIPAEWPLAGQSLSSLKVRERFGVSVALIERGRKRLPAPGRDSPLFPRDRLGVIGTDSQLDKFKHFINEKAHEHSDIENIPYVLRSFYLDSAAKFVGKMIRDSGIRELTDGLVVGIERDGVRILNPDSNIELRRGDLLWLVGNEQKIDQLKSL